MHKRDELVGVGLVAGEVALGEYPDQVCQGHGQIRLGQFDLGPRVSVREGRREVGEKRR